MPTKKPVAQDIQVQIQKWRSHGIRLQNFITRKLTTTIDKEEVEIREIPILIYECQISNTKEADKSKSKSKFWHFVDGQAHKTWTAITTQK